MLRTMTLPSLACLHLNTTNKHRACIGPKGCTRTLDMCCRSTTLCGVAVVPQERSLKYTGRCFFMHRM